MLPSTQQPVRGATGWDSEQGGTPIPACQPLLYQLDCSVREGYLGWLQITPSRWEG